MNGKIRRDRDNLLAIRFVQVQLMQFLDNLME